jgi:hypothetical protein
MGCGAAFLDYDSDGWQESSCSQAAASRPLPRRTIRLYRNNRDRHLHRCHLEFGWTKRLGHRHRRRDYDNEAYDDLFITCWGQNLLFHNNGDGTFTNVTAKAGLLHTEIATQRMHLDRLRSRWPPRSVRLHYLAFDQVKVSPRGKVPDAPILGVPVYCGPAGLPQEVCCLYHNNGDGTFTDVSRQSGISDSQGPASP